MVVEKEDLPKKSAYKKILVIKGAQDTFEMFYNREMEKFGIEVWERRLCGNHKYRWANRLTSMWDFKRKNLDKELKKYDLIIVFEWYRFILFTFMIGIRKTSRVIFWNWNIAKMNWKYSLLSHMCEWWTFDPGDAKKYGWNLNSQFYFKDAAERIQRQKQNEYSAGKDKKKVFFIGLDKGRYSLLKKLQSVLGQHNVSTDFWLVRETGKTYQEEDNDWLKEEGLSYEEVLDHILQSDAVVDIMQDGQTGYTVRVLEAIFYHKKLITNNIEILNADFYNCYKKNIFVIGHNCWDEIDNFLECEIVPVDESILKKYDIEGWIAGFYR